MRGYFIGDDSLMHMEHLSIKSLICFDIQGYQIDITVNGERFAGLNIADSTQ